MKKIDKIFGDKKASAVIYIVLAVGILMLAGGNGFLHSDTDNKALPGAVSKNTAEENLRQILSEIDGVGEVSVMLCQSEVAQKNEQSVFSSSDKQYKSVIDGVLVVAEGGKDAAVREKIIRATKAALGVDAHKIEVLERIV